MLRATTWWHGEWHAGAEKIYLALRAEAEGTGQPATLLARQAIEAWLRDRKKTALHEAIAAYGTQHAGTEVDLDPALEEAGAEVLRRGARRRR